MSVKPGVALGSLVLVFITMVALGVVFVSHRGEPGEQVVAYDEAGKSLPVLEALAQEHVTFLRVQDWCRAYADGREQRANDLGASCTFGNGYALFDDASKKRFEGLRDKLDDLPYDVNWLTIEYGSDGGLRKADLSIDTVNPFKRDSLTYDPGYTLPEKMPKDVAAYRIDDDWYYTWEDWN
ncbi:hypothetical protein ACQP2X_15025 [Actinoplanes sp. CA-131856]